ncbi:MAG: RNA polymerase sigma-70 factor (ECF subfamily) [Bacteriovoracaceae bacterium]|jgi:RNA polymerase sigma-70 factor (ECF subfamily)
MNPLLNADSLTDEQLMVKYQQGDYMAFEALYYRHEKTVFTYLSKRLRDSHAREEVFQNIFLKFHRSRDLYSNKFLFIKWLYTVSRSELYDYCKKKKIITIPLEETLVQTEIEQEGPFQELLDLDEIAKLSKNEKEAIKLRYYSDKDFEEISKALSTSQSNARKLVSRGIKKIKLSLKGGLNEGS